MTFTSIFGGSTIYPSQVSYLALVLDSGDTSLMWPQEGASGADPLASTIDVTATGAARTITLPSALQGSVGFAVLFNSLSASTYNTFIADSTGSILATVAPGEQWMLYLAANTAAGTWRAFRFGASTATVNPSTLAGYGLTNTSGTLSQSHSVTGIASSPRTIAAADRASALVWTGTGACTFNLTAAATLGNNYFCLIRNSGGGDVTIDPSASELIDGGTTLVLQPGGSVIIVTDGTAWYSIGAGQSAVFAFDFTTISLAGAAATYTLSGAELNRVSYKFTGLLTNNVAVIVPPTVQQYWVDNRTTGAYTLTVKTSTGAGVVVGQSTRGIYYCNGTDVVLADTASLSTPIAVSDGGTGVTSYTVGDILYASAGTTLAKLPDVASGNALISGGVGLAPAYGKIGLTTHVSGTLPVANGGTGVATMTSGYVYKGVGTSPMAVTVIYDDGSNIGIGTASPSSKLDVNSGALGTTSGDVLELLRLGGTSTNDTRMRFRLVRTAGGSDWTTAAMRLQARVDSVSQGYLEFNPPSGNYGFAVGTGSGGTPVERFRIDGNGNSGFGTTTPTNFGANYTTVHVSGSSGGVVRSQGGSVIGDLYADTAGTVTLRTVGSYPLVFQTNSVERARFDTSGNLGLGTTAPGGKLDVSTAGTTNVISRSTAGSAYFVRYGATGNSAGDIYYINGAEVGRLTYSGASANLNALNGFVLTNTSGTVLAVAGTGYEVSAYVDYGGSVTPYGIGFKDFAWQSNSGAYTLARTDRDGAVYLNGSTGAVTIPPFASVPFSIGSRVTVINDSGNARTLTQGAGVTLRWANTGATGNRTLADGGVATLVQVSVDRWFVYGFGIT